jgi:glucose-1-phosphate thymidylyltransferase short form/dTDP-4-dehydrorhamnose reductase
MKILIVGAKGMLGQELAKVFSESDLTLWDKEDLDITNREQVSQKIEELRPDVVINSAAYNNVDGAEEDFETALRVNGEGPSNLARASESVGARFVQYSSDYVFDGSRKEGYTEDDIPQPISKYGESKLATENIFVNCINCYLIRTSRLFGMPASSEGAKKSFVDIMIKLGKEKDNLDLVDEEWSNPTYVVDLAKQTKVLLDGGYNPGVYHITNEGACTWYGFAQEIFHQAGINIQTIPVGGDKFPRPAARPMYSSLLNKKLPLMRPWQVALRDYLTSIDEIKAINYNSMKKVMKGIILAGGKGTRLFPLTKITSKQLLPVYNKAMVMYPLETLIKAGIKEILIIVAPEYAGDYLRLLGSGKEWGVKLTYEIQDEPKGLPEAFIIGENFIGEDNVTMILGDNIFFDHDFTDDIQSFENGGRIFALEVPDPERFGVVEFNESKKVLSIDEKPKEPKSNFAIPGIYIYDNRVCNIAKEIKPTWRPETDITDVHKAFLSMNELDVRMVDGRWLDAGTHESLLKASNWMASKTYQKDLGFDE